MTSPSKYTIQLLEGIHDDAQRHHLAMDAARLLGTNAEQLEQLLARGIGARIARAGSEKRAEHVAGLLRSVGVKVEVVAPQEGLAVVEDRGRLTECEAFLLRLGRKSQDSQGLCW